MVTRSGSTVDATSHWVATSAAQQQGMHGGACMNGYSGSTADATSLWIATLVVYHEGERQGMHGSPRLQRTMSEQ